MPDQADNLDFQALKETCDLECKAAGGRDGKGKLPQDFWETYSAMANTDGGCVLLGVSEKKGRFKVSGVERIEQVKRDLLAMVNNPQKASVNLLDNRSLESLSIDGKNVLKIRIPRARREQQPIFINGNPIGNTFQRLHEADQRLDSESVKRLLAEQQDESRDGRILVGYGPEDVDSESLRAYRQLFSNLNPANSWTTLSDVEFLDRIGAWKKNRTTGERGLTLAGLLMFGTHPTIQEALPNYRLDYQERSEASKEARWIDRVTLDGNWSGNLFDFYRRVYPKLTSSLKVPFALQDGLRNDDTPVHQALREALANTIVHADYSDRASVFIVKRPDLFGFRNPGLMRIPIEVALKGGEPDCRNRLLHQMFRYIKIGEQAGFGVPKILDGWRSQQWREPFLRDSREPYNQTILELRMTSLFPEEAVENLQERYAFTWQNLNQNAKLALLLAYTENAVTHQRLSQLCVDHRTDISQVLRDLVQDGLLNSQGASRGTTYHIPGHLAPSPEDVFGSQTSPTNLEASSANLEASSANLEASSANLRKTRDPLGRIVNMDFEHPFVDDLENLTNEEQARLTRLAARPRDLGRVSQNEMKTLILSICSEQFVTIKALSQIISRKEATLRGQYLSKMVKSGSLKQAFPRNPSDPRQAYLTS